MVTLKQNLPVISALSQETLGVAAAKEAHLNAVKAYKSIVEKSAVLKTKSQAITAPYKAWEELTFTLAQLVAQKERVDKLSSSPDYLEKKSEKTVVLDDLSIEGQDLYQAIRALINSLQGGPESAGESKKTSLSSTVATIKHDIEKWEEKLKSFMDEEIYVNYIEKNKEEKKIDLSSHWLLQLGSGLSNIKTATEVVESLIKESGQKQTKYATPASNMQARMQNTQKLCKEVTALVKSFDELRDKFNHKEEKIILLKVPAQFQAYVPDVLPSSLSDFEGFSKALIDKIREKLTEHPFLKRLVELIKCQTLQEFLNVIISDLPRDESSLQPSLAVEQGMELLRNYESLNADYLSPPGMIAKVRFAFRHFSAFNALKNDMDVLEEPLRLAYQNKGLKHAEELNDFLYCLFLWIDELKMRFFLKEEFLTSQLHPLMEGFNQQLAGLGYEFTPERRYPYTDAILQQRKKFNALEDKKQSALQKFFINKRIQEAETRSELEKKECEEKINKLDTDAKTSTKKIITDAIQYRITELKRKSQIFSNIPSKKIALLEKLISSEEEKGPKSDFLSLQERFEKLKSDPDYYLLFEGQTGRCLRGLRYHGATHADLIMELNSEVDRLKSQYENWVFFRERFQKTIKACQKLSELLNRPGYSLKEALDDLKAIDRPSYQLLLKRENALLQKIRTIEAHIPAALRPKKQILQRSAESDEKQEVKTTQDITPYIDREIRLLKERRYEAVRFFPRTTKMQLESSITLLSEYKENKERTLSPQETALLKKFAPVLLKKLCPR